MADDPNFELKIQLINEYLRTGGIQKIPDPALLEDIINFNKDIPETITGRMRAFMNLTLHSHMRAPYFSENAISEYKSLIQKAYCFDQITINTEEEFDKVYDEFKNSKEVLYRGQREAKWRLYSNLQRTWILKELSKRGKVYQEFLETLVKDGLENFKDKILELLEVHHIDVINNIAVLGFLQHHGCPTPLLDWTYKFQNALYFGLDGLTENEGPLEIEDYFSVYYIKQEDMEGGGMRQVMDASLDELDAVHSAEVIAEVAKNEEQRKEMEEHFKGRKIFDKDRIPGSGLIEYVTRISSMMGFPISFFSDKDAVTGFIFSLNNSKNILNQKGVFTWNASSFKPLEVVGAEIYLEEQNGVNSDDYRFCECLNINKKLANYILQRLEDEGITKDFIYPTKDIDTWGIFEKAIQ
jgi:hypothetical protein